MSTTPKIWPTHILDKWPDFLEVYINEDTGEVKGVFVVERKNSRSFTLEQHTMLKTLEQLGLTVKVRVNMQDFNLDDFLKAGVYGSQRSSVMSRQAYYNARSELRRLDNMLQTFPADDPRREDINKKRTRVITQLESEFPSPDPEKLTVSDNLLSRLENVVNKEKTHEK